MPPTPDLGNFGIFVYFSVGNGLTEAREAFKKTPGGRSSVLTEYEPVGSHGDPVQVIFVFKHKISKVRFLEKTIILPLGGSCGSRNIKFPIIVPTNCIYFDIRLPQSAIFRKLIFGI